MSDETVQNGIKRNQDGTFANGTAPGPGRPEDTPEKTLIKRAIKDLVKEYKEDLAQFLPEIKPILRELAQKGDMSAIKEIHDRVMDRAKQATEHSGEVTIHTPIYGNKSVPRHNSNTEDISTNQENQSS